MTGRDGWRRATFVATLIVAAAAGAATAHGLYEVAARAGQPPAIAALYPIMTDGLALVAYASSVRLTGHGRGYAASVVVLAAVMSGLAQAIQLAGGLGQMPPIGVRFAIGAWVAVAFLLAVHLAWLMRRTADQTEPAAVTTVARTIPDRAATTSAGREPTPSTGEPPNQARVEALTYRERFGVWPTQRALADTAHISPTTARRVIQRLETERLAALPESNGHNTLQPS